MEPPPEKIPSVNTPVSDAMFEGHTWRWYGIYCRDLLAQNQNEPSFKYGWIPQSLSHIDIFLHCLPIKWLRIFFLVSMYRATKEAYIDPLTYGYLL